MAELTQDCRFPSLYPPAASNPLAGWKGYKPALSLGVLSAAAAALLICAPWTGIAAAALTILALAAAGSEWFLLLVIFLLPLNWIAKADLPVRDVMMVVRLVVVAGFFLGWVWRGSVGAARLLEPSLTRAAVVFAAVAVVSVALATAGWTHESERELFRLASYLGFYLLILVWVDSAERLERVGYLLLVSVMVVSLFALLQEISGGFTPLWLLFNPPDEYFIPWSDRAPSFFAYSNTLAAYLNLVLPFALACYALGRGKWKKTGAWAVGLGLVGLLCTQSLGGLVSFGCVVVVAIFYFVRRWGERLLLLSSTGALGCGYYLASGWLNPSHVAAATAYDSSIRLLMWSAAWETFKQSPVMGVGWGNFLGSYASNPTFARISPQLLYANNLYLDLLAGAGVVGFIAFSVPAYLAIRQGHLRFQSASGFMGKALAFGVMGAVVASLIHGLVDDVIIASPQAGTLWWILLALPVASASLEARARQGTTPGGGGAFRPRHG